MLGGLLAVLLGRRPLSPGSGLVWALGFGLLTWIVVTAALAASPGWHGGGTTMLDVARDRFPLLAAFLVWCIPVGIAVGSLRDVPHQERRFDPLRAVVAGGFAGVFGGWAFGKWMEQAGFFPLVAGLVRSDSRAVGVLLHFCIAVAIGATFGLLFQREARGYGSSLVCGASV